MSGNKRLELDSCYLYLRGLVMVESVFERGTVLEKGGGEGDGVGGGESAEGEGGE